MRLAVRNRFVAMTLTALAAVAALCLLATFDTASAQAAKEPQGMQVSYLEIVSKDVDGVCAAYKAMSGVEFSDPVAALGNARTAAMPNGTLLGVRAPMRDTEAPVVRPYWLVNDIKAAVAAVIDAGGQLAMAPTKAPGYCTFAIYVQGGNDHGLWQKETPADAGKP